MSVLGGSTHTHTLPHCPFFVLGWRPCGCYSCTRLLCWNLASPGAGDRDQDRTRAAGAGEQQSARRQVVEGHVGDAQVVAGCPDGRLLLLQSHSSPQVRRGGPRQAGTKSRGTSRFTLAVLATTTIRLLPAGYRRPLLLLFSLRRNGCSLPFPLPPFAILDMAGAASRRGRGASRGLPPLRRSRRSGTHDGGPPSQG